MKPNIKKPSHLIRLGSVSNETRGSWGGFAETGMYWRREPDAGRHPMIMALET